MGSKKHYVLNARKGKSKRQIDSVKIRMSTSSRQFIFWAFAFFLRI